MAVGRGEGARVWRRRRSRQRRAKQRGRDGGGVLRRPPQVRSCCCWGKGVEPSVGGLARAPLTEKGETGLAWGRGDSGRQGSEKGKRRGGCWCSRPRGPSKERERERETGRKEGGQKEGWWRGKGFEGRGEEEAGGKSTPRAHPLQPRGRWFDGAERKQGLGAVRRRGSGSTAQNKEERTGRRVKTEKREGNTTAMRPRGRPPRPASGAVTGAAHKLGRGARQRGERGERLGQGFDDRAQRPVVAATSGSRQSHHHHRHAAHP